MATAKPKVAAADVAAPKVSTWSEAEEAARDALCRIVADSAETSASRAKAAELILQFRLKAAGDGGGGDGMTFEAFLQFMADHGRVGHL